MGNYIRIHNCGLIPASTPLRRNLRSCKEDTKANAYFTMVRSNLDIARQCGILIKRIKFTKWRLFKEGQQGLLQTGTETPAAFHPCLTIFSGSH